MKFIISYYRDKSYEDCIAVGNLFINYSCIGSSYGREFIRYDRDFVLLADTNISIHQALLQRIDSASIVRLCLSQLTNGFVIFVDKTKETILLVNDFYGYYGLYHSSSNGSIAQISSSFEKLISRSNCSTDLMAVLDMILFNYVLLDRTMIQGVKRLKGGSVISFGREGVSVDQKQAYESIVGGSVRTHSLEYEKYAQSMVKAISYETIPSAETVLTLTGGFDSRLLLAALLKLNIPFGTITFGQEGNIEQELAGKIARSLELNHSFIRLDRSYIEGLNVLTNDYIRLNLSNPVIQDITHYMALRKIFRGKNIVTGYMGGELLSGQSLGAQVTYTEAADSLLKAKSPREFEDSISDLLRKIGYIKHDLFSPILHDYSCSLSTYFSETRNLNVAKFLFNEKYAKFFGAVNNVYKDEANLIAPNMSLHHITYLLSTKESMVNKESSKSLLRSISRYRLKQTQALAICLLAPSLKNTRLDRLYKVGDLCSAKGMMKVGIGYFMSHALKTNKKLYPRPYEYDIWYVDMLLDTFNNNPISRLLINTDMIPSKDQLYRMSVVERRKMINVMSCVLSLSFIKDMSGDR